MVIPAAAFWDSDVDLVQTTFAAPWGRISIAQETVSPILRCGKMCKRVKQYYGLQVLWNVLDKTHLNANNRYIQSPRLF